MGGTEAQPGERELSLDDGADLDQLEADVLARWPRRETESKNKSKNGADVTDI